MVALRCLPLLLLVALGGTAQAQDAAAPFGGGSRPSVPSAPSVPSLADTGGPADAAAMPGDTGARRVLPPSPNARPERTGSTSRGPSPQLLGAGTFGGTGAGLENVLNSGAPPSWDRSKPFRKVCPPELENRNNVCVAPVGSVIQP